MGYSKTFFIPEAKGLSATQRYFLLICDTLHQQRFQEHTHTTVLYL